MPALTLIIAIFKKPINKILINYFVFRIHKQLNIQKLLIYYNVDLNGATD